MNPELKHHYPRRCRCNNPTCLHRWLSREPEKPEICPKCKSRNWFKRRAHWSKIYPAMAVLLFTVGCGQVADPRWIDSGFVAIQEDGIERQVQFGLGTDRNVKWRFRP